MQSGKNAAASVKETAANVLASANSGMEKTKATVQEKMERMTAHDPLQKELATEKKQERLTQAEIEKQEDRHQNAAAKQAESGGGHTGGGGPTTTTYSTTGTTTGTHQISAMPGHGTGQPTGGHVTEGVVGSHPIGTNTNRVTGNPNAQGTGYGTGGTYN